MEIHFAVNTSAMNFGLNFGRIKKKNKEKKTQQIIHENN